MCLKLIHGELHKSDSLFWIYDHHKQHTGIVQLYKPFMRVASDAICI